MQNSKSFAINGSTCHLIPQGDFRPTALLDIGCGAGDFLAMARKQGFKVYGLELSAPAAKLATEYYNIQVDLQDIADDPREGFFDVVTLIGLLEHVIDPRDMLRHAHRLLSSNGILFIYTPVWGKWLFRNLRQT